MAKLPFYPVLHGLKVLQNVRTAGGFTVSCHIADCYSIEGQILT